MAVSKLKGPFLFEFSNCGNRKLQWPLSYLTLRVYFVILY